ncbi:30S ribosomal protein S9 [Patescibacteria group bacterium]|nr:30S ribosomal protein S9 [Patescibacteria group bacterium]MBU4481444.1 30S ribosomal protein S9 [Patescibacteria group bacterium]
MEKTTKKKEKPKLTSKPEKYLEAVGRRKTAIARVRLLIKGEKSFLINGKPLAHYLPGFELQKIANSPLEKMNCLDKFGILAKVKGGGIHAQAEAIRLGIARALILFNPDFRKRLKRVNYLTRDPRMKERKKFGLKRARRAPQWQKR